LGVIFGKNPFFEVVLTTKECFLIKPYKKGFLTTKECFLIKPYKKGFLTTSSSSFYSTGSK